MSVDQTERNSRFFKRGKYTGWDYANRSAQEGALKSRVHLLKARRGIIRWTAGEGCCCCSAPVSATGKSGNDAKTTGFTRRSRLCDEFKRATPT